MRELKSYPVIIHAIYDGFKKSFYPKAILWKDNKYPITKVAYHHKFKIGDAWTHVFSLMSETKFIKICFDGKTLEWTLQEFIDEQIQ
jgi:hypothetical protein